MAWLLSEICLAGVATHHPLAVEVMADVADCLLHHPAPSRRVRIKSGSTTFSSLSYSKVACRSAEPASASVPIDQPVYAIDARLDPPAIKDAQVQHAVKRCLHSEPGKASEFRFLDVVFFVKKTCA
jgi:hypothetical protein